MSDQTKSGNKEYTCAMCGQTFDRVTCDEAANQEALELWGVENASERLDEDMAVVCDRCFQSIHPDKFPEEAEAARKEIRARGK